MPLTQALSAMIAADCRAVDQSFWGVFGGIFLSSMEKNLDRKTKI